MTFLHVLPLAVVMIAGPQVLSAVFFATSDGWRAKSLAYVAGAAISISIVVTLAFLLSNGATEQGTSHETIYWIVLALILFAIVHTYLGRKKSEPPGWMGRLESADTRFSFRLGFLLLGIFPSDLVTSISVGSYVTARKESIVSALPFVLLTIFLLAVPFLAVLLLGERGERALPKVRDWMNANSWIVNEAVLVFFVVLVVNDLA